MKLYYRISDKSYNKPKLMGATKEVCLMNFVQVFRDAIYGKGPPPDGYVPSIRVVADNCERTTVKMLAETGFPMTLSELGNAGSLMKAVEMATEGDPEELVYFCEDDYLHLSHAPRLLEEGIKRADYVTIYDHPDKYTRHYNGGEYSKVIKTASSHWRYTVSTCMTFGVKVKTLKEDMEVWKQFTTGTHPHDHQIFTELGKKGRRLAVCIPGAACHTDLTFSGAMASVMMEQWAIDMMADRLSEEILLKDHQFNEGKRECDRLGAYRTKAGWERLVALSALLHDMDKK
jgi:hypothetical protein